ncbi:Multiple epidermal growth factor-like domains protein 6 [Galemys pyrenaicus]|uniref:Multiple epidermal growth factor-like domains protein 6 n=1 Tax=Galemys pyrenaicus TaxID=202257 RepID=A0A8J6DGJ0_GALPY|nr:Multiple epidermal growth factor-like domains protein 6 [Galemys pyrenaicus]
MQVTPRRAPGPNLDSPAVSGASRCGAEGLGGPGGLERFSKRRPVPTLAALRKQRQPRGQRVRPCHAAPGRRPTGPENAARAPGLRHGRGRDLSPRHHSRLAAELVLGRAAAALSPQAHPVARRAGRRGGCRPGTGHRARVRGEPPLQSARFQMGSAQGPDGHDPGTSTRAASHLSAPPGLGRPSGRRWALPPRAGQSARGPGTAGGTAGRHWAHTRAGRSAQVGPTLSPRVPADVDECQTHNGGCQHSCVNTPGSYLCRCQPGFRLHADGRTCLGECPRSATPSWPRHNRPAPVLAAP